MHWLLHGSLAPAVTDALLRHKQKPHPAIEAGLPPDATPAETLKLAYLKQWEILTNSSELASEPFTGSQRFNRTIVYLQLPGGEVEQDDAIDRLFGRYPRLVPGRLYTVTESRVKIRQLPERPRNRNPVEFQEAPEPESASFPIT
jgi:hypothetical protein